MLSDLPRILIGATCLIRYQKSISEFRPPLFMLQIRVETTLIGANS